MKLRIGDLELASRFVLAPLAGYTNLSFRMAIRELGGLGMATTDLVNARALLRTSRRTLELIQTCPVDRPLAVQLYGTDPGEMSAAAQWLEAYGVSSVDVNMGCPVHKVTRGGGGSAMMCDPGKTVALMRTIVDSVRIPVTVKMRLGWDHESLSAPFFAREFEQVGVAAVTIHGRTRAQGFGGKVHLDGIRAVVEAVEKMPVLGNGDVRTLEDASRMLSETGCAGLALGRGALLNPWIFAQLGRWMETGESGPQPTYAQRWQFMNRHFHLLVEHRGEHFACLTFRKVANWYCKVLRPGHDIQQSLVRIGSAADFDRLAHQMMAANAHRSHEEWQPGSVSIAVPQGPFEHW